MDYLNELRQPVERLQARMQKTQSNLERIRSITSTWTKIPLFERKDGKKDAVLCLEERNDRISKRYAAFTEMSSTIHEYKHFLKIVSELFSILTNLTFSSDC